MIDILFVLVFLTHAYIDNCTCGHSLHRILDKRIFVSFGPVSNRSQRHRIRPCSKEIQLGFGVDPEATLHPCSILKSIAYVLHFQTSAGRRPSSASSSQPYPTTLAFISVKARASATFPTYCIHGEYVMHCPGEAYDPQVATALPDTRHHERRADFAWWLCL